MDSRSAEEKSEIPVWPPVFGHRDRGWSDRLGGGCQMGILLMRLSDLHLSNYHSAGIFGSKNSIIADKSYCERCQNYNQSISKLSSLSARLWKRRCPHGPSSLGLGRIWFRSISGFIRPKSRSRIEFRASRNHPTDHPLCRYVGSTITILWLSFNSNLNACFDFGK